MGFWSALCCFLRANSPCPSKSKSKKRQLDEDEDDVYHSPECIRYNTFGLQETGYTDEATLRNALAAIFGDSSLNFGIRTRNDRWCYYAPRAVQQAELAPYL